MRGVIAKKNYTIVNVERQSRSKGFLLIGSCVLKHFISFPSSAC